MIMHIILYQKYASTEMLIVKWPQLHLGKLQRVMISSPVLPDDTYTELRVYSAQVETVEVGVVTVAVPPGTFVHRCTAGCWVHIVILVSSAELLS